jgi:hypothetical protein
MWEWLPATIPSRLEAAPTAGDRKINKFIRQDLQDRQDGMQGVPRVEGSHADSLNPEP